MARVQVSDEVWSAFRAGLGATPVSVALGLVRQEVGRRERRTASDEQGVRLALDDARVLAGELQEMVARLEHQASSTEPRAA
jgi:inorganic triphosphatase YgiF